MKNIIKIEVKDQKSTFSKMVILSTLSSLISLYFFGLIGKFDSSPDSLIFTTYGNIISFSYTINFAFSVIFGSFIYSHKITKHYIGDSRIILYSYPLGRGTLFMLKNLSYILLSSPGVLFGMNIATLIFYLSENILPILPEEADKYPFLHSLVLSLSATMLTTASILLSGLVGIYRKSVTSTIAASIIIVLLFGNILFIIFSNILLSIITSSAAFFISLLALARQKQSIQNDDVLS